MTEQTEVQIPEDNRTQEEVFQDIFWRLGYIQGKLEGLANNLDRCADRMEATIQDFKANL